MVLLEAKSVTVVRSGQRIVQNISFVVDHREMVALLGPNGAGKTTLLQACAGLVPLQIPPSKLLLDGQECQTWRIDQRVAAGIVYVPQSTSLFRELSLLDNLTVVYEYHPVWQAKPYDEFYTIMHEYLSLVGLSKIIGRKAGVLSGGQKRKLEIVRALLMKARIIMCDEPFAGVDPKSMHELQELFDHLVAAQGLSMLISDHNVEHLLSHAATAYVVLDGQVVAHGTAQQVLQDPITRQRYLGEKFGTKNI